MSLEEKLRAYAAKGELVHLSLAFSGDRFVARFAAATPGGGYASGENLDPVEAIEAALKASPAKPARVTKPREEVTAAVKPERHYGEVLDEMDQERAGALPQDWTAP